MSLIMCNNRDKDNCDIWNCPFRESDKTCILRSTEYEPEYGQYISLELISTKTSELLAEEYAEQIINIKGEGK
jgi:hypothetical protein